MGFFTEVFLSVLPLLLIRSVNCIVYRSFVCSPSVRQVVSLVCLSNHYFHDAESYEEKISLSEFFAEEENLEFLVAVT